MRTNPFYPNGRCDACGFGLRPNGTCQNDDCTRHVAELPLPKVGDRIRLLAMPNDPDPVPVGSTGTVSHVFPPTSLGGQQVGVEWDNGRSLLLLVGVDQFEILPPASQVEQRLEYLRGEIRAERISYSEIAELQSLAEHIKKGDTELLEWAGVPEFDDSPVTITDPVTGSEERT